MPELASALRLKQNSTQKILDELLVMKVLSSFLRKNRKYFIVNQKFVWPAELRALANKHKKNYWKERIFSEVVKLGDMKAGFLSGFLAGQPNLPVDILLVGRLDLRKLNKFLLSAKKELGQDLNYSIMSPDEFVLRRDTFDRFIRDIFDYKHIVLFDRTAKKK